MDIAPYIEILKTTFIPYIKDIHGFHFYFNNPLFWVFVMVLYLILEIGRSWSPGKAFFFCVSIAIVLLGATWFERLIAATFAAPGENFDPLLIRVLSLIILLVAILYFVLIDNS
jgi:hypothetical protein